MLTLATGKRALVVCVAVACSALASFAHGAPAAKHGVARQGSTACNSHWLVVPSVDVGQSFGDFNSLSSVVAISSNDVWAVGLYDRFASSSYYHTLAEHWNGTAWSVVPTVDSSRPNNILDGVSADASNDVWAVGYERQSSGYYYTLIEHYDGTKWSIVQDGTEDGWLTSVFARASNDVWAVGSTNYVGNGLIEHWDGQKWTTTLLHGAEFLNDVLALASDDVWTVGFRSTKSGSGVGDDTFTAHFDGTKWTHVRSPSPLKLHYSDQNWLRSVTATASNRLWAVGVTRNGDYGIFDDTLTEHWNGRRWKVHNSPDPGGSNMYNDLNGVAAMSPGDVWAVGSVGQVTFQPLAMRWNGSGWHTAKTPQLQGALLGVGRDAATGLWAVGNRVRDLGKSDVHNGTLIERLCSA